MPLMLFHRRTVWMPTPAGWLIFALALAVPILLWCFRAEAFLSLTDRVPAPVLVLEAWTDAEGADAAAREFRRPGAEYTAIVVAGGLTGEAWTRRRWSYPELAAEELLRDGIAPAQIIQAECPDVPAQRTFWTALTARSALQERGLHPRSIDVLTETVHARRSRLVFQRAFGGDVKVGVVSWTPAIEKGGYWWRSSARALELIKETIAYPWEAVFHSGRGPSLSRGARLPPPRT